MRFSLCVLLALPVGTGALSMGCGTYQSEFHPSNAFGDGGSGIADATSGGDTGEAAPTLVPTGNPGPTTCDESAMTRSYIGCDYWPTVTTNPVWSIFDFTVVVANAQDSVASVTVTGPGGVNQTVSVAPSTLQKIYLPWVTVLKGPDCDACGEVPVFAESVSAPASAYHLVSSIPVTVYQFNALEYKGEGGPAGKDWSSCPGSAQLCVLPDGGGSVHSGCYSYTNDASLLIPSTAMTGNYRISGDHAVKDQEGSYFAITAVNDATHVTVNVSQGGSVVGGGTIQATPAGGTMTLTMNSGDVVEIMSDMLADTTDLSGSLVQADQPVQVISGTQCSEQPEGYPACDHLESSVLPAETLGSDYVVTVPTSPNGTAVGHVVRFYGNVDGTTLTYSPSQPAGCPSTLDAGQVVACTGIVKTTFQVTGSNEFAVSSFQLGGYLLNELTHDNSPDGDPSMSPMIATQQYLQSYLFLAPPDYEVSYVDIVAPPGTALDIDGHSISGYDKPVNASWSVSRVPLGAGIGGGSHVLTASNPVGAQVVGYGAYTSYQYPAGLDLSEISPPPLK